MKRSEYQIYHRGDLQYTLALPHDYQAGRRYPLLLLLHGAGGRGRDTEVLRNNPFMIQTEAYEDFPFIVVAPQCHSETWFDLFADITALLYDMAARPDVDRKHIYGIGASMGAYGLWQLAMSHPDIFAAIVPICGGGMYWDAGRLQHTAVWAFHGAKDDVVYPEESKKMVDAVNRTGGHARLTIYPENDHNAWDDTYSNPAVFAWMLEQEKDGLESDAPVLRGNEFG